MPAILAQVDQAFRLRRHQQLAFETGWDEGIQFQGLHGDYAACLGHGAGIGCAVAVALGAGDILAVFAPAAGQFVVEQHQGAFLAVQPVPGDECSAGERLATIWKVGGDYGLLYFLAHGFLQSGAAVR
ncbi:hypothetical protein [Pseudomonas fluorescens group sp. PF-69]